MWSPGAWWFVLSVLSVGLLLPSPVFFMFPRWLKEPRWLVRRRQRQRRLEEKREARRLELLEKEKERRRRRRRRKKRELERRKRKANAAKGSSEISSAVDGAVTSPVQNGGGDKSAVSSSGDDLESFPSNDVGTSDQHSSNDEPLNAVAKSTGNFEKNDDVKYLDDDRESAPSNDEEPNRNDQRNKDDTQTTESAENCNRRGSKVSQNSRGCNDAKRTADDGQASSDPTQLRDPERVEVEMPQTTDTGNGEITAKTEEADVSQADQRNRKRYALGRKLQGL